MSQEKLDDRADYMFNALALLPEDELAGIRRDLVKAFLNDAYLQGYLDAKDEPEQHLTLVK